MTPYPWPRRTPSSLSVALATRIAASHSDALARVATRLVCVANCRAREGSEQRPPHTAGNPLGLFLQAPAATASTGEDPPSTSRLDKDCEEAEPLYGVDDLAFNAMDPASTSRSGVAASPFLPLPLSSGGDEEGHGSVRLVNLVVLNGPV